MQCPLNEEAPCSSCRLFNSAQVRDMTYCTVCPRLQSHAFRVCAAMILELGARGRVGKIAAASFRNESLSAHLETKVCVSEPAKPPSHKGAAPRKGAFGLKIMPLTSTFRAHQRTLHSKHPASPDAHAVLILSITLFSTRYCCVRSLKDISAFAEHYVGSTAGKQS